MQCLPAALGEPHDAVEGKRCCASPNISAGSRHGPLVLIAVPRSAWSGPRLSEKLKILLSSR